MKICYIADGKSIHIQRWVNYFAQKGHEVHLISYQFPPGYEGFDKRIKIHRLIRLLPQMWRISRYPSVFIWVSQVRLLIQKIKPEILHAHYLSVYGHLAAMSGFYPIVQTAWGSDILVEAEKSRITSFLTKYSLRRAELITCEAEHLSKHLVSLGANPRKIKLVCWGIDTDKFSPGSKDKKLIEALGIANSPVIISSRFLEPIYDVESLAEAIPIILRREPKAKFLIVGRGSQEIKLKELATSLGVASSVVFTGYIPNDELPRYLRIADIYVSTSLSDGGLSQCTAEAMACELPVVITDFGDNNKWVDDNINGFLIPLRNPEILASKILHLLFNREERIIFARANRKKMVDRKNLKLEMEKMEACYKELLTK